MFGFCDPKGLERLFLYVSATVGASDIPDNVTYIIQQSPAIHQDALCGGSFHLKGSVANGSVGTSGLQTPLKAGGFGSSRVSWACGFRLMPWGTLGVNDGPQTRKRENRGPSCKTREQNEKVFDPFRTGATCFEGRDTPR